jgi:hypothetical protein
MRKACMIRSENAAEQCIEALQKSTHATLQDYQLIAWVRLEIIMKDVTQLLGLSDMDTPADVADIRTQCTIKAFEDRLERWKKELSPGVMHRMCACRLRNYDLLTSSQLPWRSRITIARCIFTKLHSITAAIRKTSGLHSV